MLAARGGSSRRSRRLGSVVGVETVRRSRRSRRSSASRTDPRRTVCIVRCRPPGASNEMAKYRRWDASGAASPSSARRTAPSLLTEYRASQSVPPSAAPLAIVYLAVRSLMRKGGSGETTRVGAPRKPRSSPASTATRATGAWTGWRGLNSTCALTASAERLRGGDRNLGVVDVRERAPRKRPGAPNRRKRASVWDL